jgi:hypothetical protein
MCLFLQPVLIALHQFTILYLDNCPRAFISQIAIQFRSAFQTDQTFVHIVEICYSDVEIPLVGGDRRRNLDVRVLEDRGTLVFLVLCFGEFRHFLDVIYFL